MSNFEGIYSSWDQAERHRHAALLRQLKAELQEHRRQSTSRPAIAAPVTREQPTQPDLGLVKRIRFEAK